ncbi:MAG: family 20 glycosylhydrolase [Bacteroidales bacterium]
MKTNWLPCLLLSGQLLFCAESRADSLFSSLLPQPHSISISERKGGLHPDSIIGFHLKKGTEIPFNQSYFPNRHFTDIQSGVILLEKDNSISHKEGYQISLSGRVIKIKGKSHAGILYGVQTLMQLVQNAREQGVNLPDFEITDTPDSDYRGIHIDLKHHLDKKEYMYQLLDKMAYYKLNAIILEVEDKLKYERYPSIGAPHAWSISEWKEWSEYAHKLNIEVSPLIQGIGHADYILKHPEFHALREDHNSDWVCCPSNEKYYDVQFSLYKDAIQATPHGKYVHIGGDEVGTLGICPTCKEKKKSILEHQLGWLKRVSDYVVKQGRTPIFWDDMVFKQVGLYDVILDTENPEKMDSVWNANLPLLNKHKKQFPKQVVYMRWQYGNADRKGNKMALKWYNDQGLKVMGATAAQTTYAMMPLGNGNVHNIRTFQKAHLEVPVTGVLCTAWDDASPLSDTYWKGFIAHAQFGWNISIPMENREFDDRYRIREFGNDIAGLPDFRKELESSFALWETGLLDEGVRRGMWRTGGKYTLMSLPETEPGKWSEKYAQRIEEAEKQINRHFALQQLLQKYRQKATRNTYSLQVFQSINAFTGYTGQLLLALSAYDQERDIYSLNNLKACVKDFGRIRKNLETVYAETRLLNQPEGYVLPMNHHSHLSIRTANTDWMFLFELDFIKQLEQFILKEEQQIALH